MEHDFWHNKWEKGDIGFHTGSANPLLVAHFAQLGLAEGARIFLPLCGKTLDIHWLLANGYRVAGAELSEIAIRQLFSELGVEPDVTGEGALKRYSAPDIDIFVGDIFSLTAGMLGPVDAVYDRAALVALPETVRARYAAHVTTITANARQLLICYEYHPAQSDGPPFSISDDEVTRLYTSTHDLTLLGRVDVTGGMKGRQARENVWLLNAKA